MSQILYQIQGISLKRVLEINDYSPVYIRNNEWKYHFVITKILNKRRYSTLPNGWVRINIEYLRQFLGGSSDKNGSFRFIDRIRKDLKQWGLIKTKYKTATAANGSKIKLVFAKVLDEYTVRGWRKWTPNKAIKPPMTKTKLTGIYAKIQHSLSLLSIDYKGALAFADLAKQTGMKLPAKQTGWKPKKYRVVDEAVYSSWLMAIDLIKSGVYTVKVEFKTSGRVYTAISSFPRLLRQYLILNGRQLIGLDCANSQPLLFAVYLRQHYPILTDDMLKYIQLCEQGKLYEYVTELLVKHGCTVPTNRKEFKVEFFAKLFYSKEKKNHSWRTAFATQFPNVATAISAAKKVGTNGGTPSLLTAQLSLLESEIMIKGVARRLYDSGITEFATLHDCILTTEEYTDVVYNLIAEEYAKYGVNPTIKIEE
jgi:hypothetical protein